MLGAKVEISVLYIEVMLKQNCLSPIQRNFWINDISVERPSLRHSTDFDPVNF